MSSPSAKSPYAGYRFPPEVISHAVWLYFRFPLSLRMVEEMLAARGIIVSHESVRRWALKFGQDFANRIRRRAACAGDKWHLDEVALKNCRPEALGVARGGPRWPRARYPRAEPAGQTGCQTLAQQAAEAAMPGAARHDQPQLRISLEMFAVEGDGRLPGSEGVSDEVGENMDNGVDGRPVA